MKVNWRKFEKKGARVGWTFEPNVEEGVNFWENPCTKDFRRKTFGGEDRHTMGPYSKCPDCGWAIPWIERWKLSTTRVYRCRSCGVGLLKNKKSDRLISIGAVLFIISQIPMYWVAYGVYPRFTWPLIVLIQLPFAGAGILFQLKGMRAARFFVTDPKD